MSINRARYASPGTKLTIIAPQLATAQSVVLAHGLLTEFPGILASQLSFYSFFRPAIWNFLD